MEPLPHTLQGPSRRHLATAVLLLALGPAGLLPAQQIGSGFDSVPMGQSFSAEDVFDSEAKKSRFHLGPVLIFPRLGIGGLGYSNGLALSYTSSNGEEQTTGPRKGDFTANAFAGLRLLVPISSRYRLAVDGTAYYHWFAHAVQDRALRFNSSVSALAQIGRVRIDARANLYSASIPLSSELPVRTVERSENLRFGLSVPLGSRLRVFSSLDFRAPRYDAGGSFGNEVARLDRREVAYSVGLGYELSRQLSLRGFYQATRARYGNDSTRDSNGNGYILGITYGRERLYTNLQIGYRTYDEGERNRSGLYGGLATRLRLGRSVDFTVTGSRGRTDSLFVGQSFFDEQRVGASLGYTFERLLGLHLAVTGEIGDNRYSAEVVLDGVAYSRRDDVVTYRGSVGFRIGEYIGISGALAQSRYTSNVLGYDRDVTDIQVNISLLTGGIDFIK